VRDFLDGALDWRKEKIVSGRNIFARSRWRRKLNKKVDLRRCFGHDDDVLDGSKYEFDG
jgi:hypothetical protein